MNEEQLFMAALDLPDAAARAAYLDEACGTDAGLRRQIEDLLAAHFRSGEFLDVPAAEQIQTDPSNDNTVALPGDATPAANSHDKPDDLTFLTPPTRPDSLGRLGHYEVLEVLGRGGFGIVFRAFDETLRRVVAIKVLAPAMAATSPARKRFLREAWASAKVRHENVVQVYVVEEHPLPYLVMEFVPGETLQQRLDRTGPLDAQEVARVGRQIAEGLAAAHATGLIHRDIKPANILLDGGPHQRVKITDFGLARAADDASLTQSGMIAGTPMYMAPEQAQCDALDHRADLFSLGSVLYVMCTGRPPFRASSTLAVLRRVAEDTPRPIPDVIPETPQWLCDLITRLHAKRPEDRIGTAREVADLLGSGLAEMQHAGNLPLAAVATPPMKEVPEAAPAIRRPRSRIGRWALAAAVLLTLAGGIGLTETSGVTDVRGTVIRLFSPEGTLVVEVDDPNISVRIDGSELVITGAGAREIRLKPGRYTVEARKDGKVVRRELVSVTKNGRQVVRVTQVAAPKDPDRRAAEHVLSLGGVVRVNEEGRDRKSAAELPREPFRLTAVELKKNKQVSDAGLALFKDCKDLKELWLQGTQVSDAGLAHFKGCTSLTWLDLGGTQVGDAGLASFAGCNNLTVLSLWGTRVSDEGLASFKDCKNMKTIWLDQTQVSDAGLRNLAAMTKLEVLYLNVNMPNVTRAGIDELRKTLPQCRIQCDVPDRRAAEYVLSIGGAVRVNDEGRDLKSPAELPRGPFRLTAVDLKENKEVGDAGLAHFRDCRDLKELGLQGTQVSDAGVAHFKGCTHLTVLILEGTPVGDEGLAHLEDCKDLRFVWLGYTQVTDAGLAHLKGCKNLNAINLGETQVGDAGLAHLAGCKDLKELWLQGTQVGDAGLAHFKGCKDLTRLWLRGTQASDAGLAHLKDCKDLRKVNLEDTRVSDAGLAHLKGCENLTDLELRKTKVTDAGIDKVKKASPKCKIVWDGGVFEPVGFLDPDRRAAEYVLSLGGAVRVNDEDRDRNDVTELPRESFRLTTVQWEENKRVSDAGLAHFKDCKDLTRLWLQGTQVSDAGLAHFKGCTKLTVLILDRTRVSDAGLAHLEGCTDLRAVSLGYTQVTDAGLAHLKGCKKLIRINLDETQVGDAGLAHLAGCKDLKELILRGTRVSDAGLALFKDCKNLTELGLAYTRVSDAGLAHFKGCKNLEHLGVEGNKEVSDVGLAHFKDCKNLTHLGLAWTQVSDSGLALFKDCKELETLSFGSTQVSDAGLAHFKGCKDLTWVHLDGTQVSDAGLALLKDCKNLTGLRLNNNLRVSDAGLAHLANCANLTELFVEETMVTAAGIAKVRKASPWCKIVWDGGVFEPTAAAWERSVAALPAEEQVKAVIARLKELNPGFDGKVTHTIVDGVVTALTFSTDRVTDLSPVRALNRLRKLNVRAATFAKGLLADLSPLKGMPLRQLDCVGTKVTDLSPLRGMGLKTLNLSSTPVSDLTPLKNMKLMELYLEQTQVTDLTALNKMKLTVLWCSFVKVSDLSPLRGMPFTSLMLRGTPIRDLEPLKAMPLKMLWIQGTDVTDLSPLKGMPLKDIRLTPGKITKGLEILRGSKSLETIGIDDRNAWPAAAFWARHDKGGVKK